jgi:hypothetical protein
MFRDDQVRQTLRTINVQRTYTKAMHKLSWVPQVVTKLFTINSVVMVNLESLSISLLRISRTVTDFGVPLS